MIIVKGSFPIKADQQPVALDLVQALAAASRKEPGCLSYEVYVHADEPRVREDENRHVAAHLTIVERGLGVDEVRGHRLLSNRASEHGVGERRVVAGDRHGLVERVRHGGYSSTSQAG